MEKNLYKYLGKTQRINKPLLFERNLNIYKNDVVKRTEILENIYQTAKKNQLEIIENMYESYAKKNVESKLLFKMKNQKAKIFSMDFGSEIDENDKIGDLDIEIKENENENKKIKIVEPNLNHKKSLLEELEKNLKMKYIKKDENEFIKNYKNNKRFREIYHSINRKVQFNDCYDYCKPSIFKIKCNYFVK